MAIFEAADDAVSAFRRADFGCARAKHCVEGGAAYGDFGFADQAATMAADGAR
jgi:hypothetical protein